MTDPAVPYSGNGGSKDRAKHLMKSGKARTHRERILRFLGQKKGKGLTYKEYDEMAGTHHGTSSGMLSVMHQEGLVAMLNERRGGSAVYVLPTWVKGRETLPHRKTVTKVVMNEVASFLRNLGDREADLLIDRMRDVKAL